VVSNYGDEKEATCPGRPFFDLTGKKALVTGGAEHWAGLRIGWPRRGRLAIVDLKEDMGSETVEMIADIGRRSMLVPCNVADVNQVNAMVETL